MASSRPIKAYAGWNMVTMGSGDVFSDDVGAADFPAMGTRASLRVVPATALTAGRRLLEALLEELDRACSRFRPDSELSRLNRSGGLLEVSPLLACHLAAALRAARATDGAVDPTVGRALRAVGYDRDFSLVGQGGPLRLRAAPVPGWQLVELGPDRRVRLPAGVELDLGATAKALAADQAARAIHAATQAAVLVSLGGDVAVASAPPGGWQVGVAEDHAARAEEVVAIRSGGLATSGTTVRRWRRGGHLLHHLIDPRTGLPARVHWRTASVAAASCLDANVAATAAIVWGPEAVERLRRWGLPARLVAVDGRVLRLNGWPEPGPAPTQRIPSFSQ